MSLRNLKKSLFNLCIIMTIVMSANLLTRAGDDCYPLDRPYGDTNTTSEKLQDVEPCPGLTPTPEPITMLLFGAGLAAVGFSARFRKKQSK